MLAYSLMFLYLIGAAALPRLGERQHQVWCALLCLVYTVPLSKKDAVAALQTNAAINRESFGMRLRYLCASGYSIESVSKVLVHCLSICYWCIC